MSKIITASKLNRLWKNGIKPIDEKVTELSDKIDNLPAGGSGDTSNLNLVVDDYAELGFVTALTNMCTNYWTETDTSYSGSFLTINGRMFYNAHNRLGYIAGYLRVATDATFSPFWKTPTDSVAQYRKTMMTSQMLHSYDNLMVNTVDGVYAAGAIAVKDGFNKVHNQLNGFSFYNNPTVVYTVADGSAYTNESGNYILADSDTGATLLADAETYTTNTVEGNFCRIEGADSVVPFRSGAGGLLSLVPYMFSESSGNIRFALPILCPNGGSVLEHVAENDAYTAPYETTFTLTDSTSYIIAFAMSYNDSGVNPEIKSISSGTFELLEDSEAISVSGTGHYHRYKIYKVTNGAGAMVTAQGKQATILARYYIITVPQGSGGGSGSGNAVRGTFSLTTVQEPVSINIGFKPKYLIVQAYTSNGVCINEYDEAVSQTEFTYNGNSYSLGNSDGYRLYSINDDGFSIRGGGMANSDWSYIAMK